MVSVTILAVYRPRSIWFKGNLGLTSAIRTSYRGHFSWALVQAITSVSISHVFHLPLYRSKTTDTTTKHLKRRLSESMFQCGPFNRAALVYMSIGQI
jgi:hypothetical protein